MDKDADGVAPAGDVEAAGDHGDLQRPARMVALVEQRLVRGDVAHGGEVREPKGERGNSCQRGFQLVPERNLWVVFLETLLPPLAQRAVGEIVRSPLPDRSGEALLSRVYGQIIEAPLLGVVGLAAAQLKLLLAPLLHLERIADLCPSKVTAEDKAGEGPNQSRFAHVQSSFFNCP